MQQIAIVPLLGRRRTEGLEALIGIAQRIEACTPTFIGKWWIGDDVVEGLERVAVFELGVGQRIGLDDKRGGVVVPAASATFSSSEPEPQVGS